MIFARDNVFRTILSTCTSWRGLQRTKGRWGSDKRDHVLSLQDRLNRFVSTGKSEPAITRARAHTEYKNKSAVMGYDTFPSKQKEKKRSEEINLSKKERVGLFRLWFEIRRICFRSLVKAALNFARRFAFALETAGP